MQERLTITKVKLIEAEEERRQEIIDQKCQKMEEISKKMEILDVERLKRKEKRGKTISKPEVVVTADAKLEQLRDTLEAKRRGTRNE